jgi:hypothetical protein
MKNYEGKYMKGFEFENGTDGVEWEGESQEYLIGEVGRIIRQHDFSVRVEFDGFEFWYPISMIEDHLTEIE